MGEGTGVSVRPAVQVTAGRRDRVAADRLPASGWGLVARFGGVAFVTVALFVGYLRMSRSRAVNADGASNVLQAWDLLHGNVLLHGWTLSDVSFYTTELIQYALIELVYGLHRDVVHVAAAMTYTLLVLLAAAVARGRSTGREGLLRAGLAVAIMLAPTPGHGYTLLLLSPDHIGTAVPLLVTWLVLDRLLARPRRWLPYLMAVLLAWAQIGDPLALFIGALPLVAVCGWRMVRARSWRGTDAQLLVAGVASVLLTQAILLAVRLAGGFSLHPPIAQFASPGKLWQHLLVTGKSLALTFGAYLPFWAGHGPFGWLGAGLNLVGLVVTLAAVGVAATALTRRPPAAPGDRVADILATAIVLNLVAFVISTQPGDLLTARQIVAVLPLGAALAGRVLIRRPALLRIPVGRIVGAALLSLTVVFAAQTAIARPVPVEAQDAAEWLQSQGSGFGLGSYWAANTTTLYTQGRVRVAPVTELRKRIYGYRWESRADWYDPARHDARFLILDRKLADYGTVATALEQFGPAVEQRDFGRFVVLRYERNLLVGLPAFCGTRLAPDMARCPHLAPRLPGSTLIFK